MKPRSDLTPSWTIVMKKPKMPWKKIFLWKYSHDWGTPLISQIRSVGRYTSYAKCIRYSRSNQPLNRKVRLYQFEANSITFINTDLERFQPPHHDLLVIQHRVHNYDVKRILVDTGIFFEVMYYDLVKQLNLTKDDLKLAQAPLVRFNAQSHWPLRNVTLNARVGSQALVIEFVLIDIPSPYNAIVVRD